MPCPNLVLLCRTCLEDVHFHTLSKCLFLPQIVSRYAIDLRLYLTNSGLVRFVGYGFSERLQTSSLVDVRLLPKRYALPILVFLVQPNLPNTPSAIVLF